MVLSLLFLLSLKARPALANSVDSIPVKGKTYTGYMIKPKKNDGDAFRITEADIARAEDSIQSFIPKFCGTVQVHYDSSDCEGMKKIIKYIRTYQGTVYAQKKGRFMRIEAFEETLFAEMRKTGIEMSDSGNKMFIFLYNLDTGELIYFGDGGWG